MTDKKAIASELETKPVVDLLASILGEVQKQVLCKTPLPLTGEAARAVEAFREITGALTLQSLPAVTLQAQPTEHGVNGGISRITWSAAAADAVSITPGIGEVTPAAGGTVSVNVATTTTFTATATNACGSATASVTVTVATLG
ncbi:hypothetical protein LPW11_04420 [Geomonas sp. RF6]|uniref:hypothetical protein n=1 Tax=Geomonas sp. RF6 TaxID=2897342 RepID=UPI001E405B1C|nr:hypothetical protein [Geomonas sp. RF6]UFS71444.1 hypothetical protein LPW11_04420 [Geomonas sp. RF6]